MSGKEWFIFVAHAFKGFQFAGAVDGSVGIAAYIKRYDADGVAGNEELVALFIIKSKSEDTAQPFDEVGTVAAVEGEDDLTVASCLELIFTGKVGADVTVVVDFAVDGQNLLAVG